MKDWKGFKNDKWEVLEFAGIKRYPNCTKPQWVCRCILCNNTSIVGSSDVNKENRKSCASCYKHPHGKNAYNYKGQNSNWYINKQGYIYTRLERPDGHKAYMHEHQLVMEKNLGRSLISGENVHHINGIRGDNRIENLELWNTSQPKGQRLEDKISFYKEFLQQYGFKVIK